MNLPRRIYPAKILLFGEYSVTEGGSALAIPYRKFNAHWSESQVNREELAQFCRYLRQKDYHFLQRDKLDRLVELECGIACNIPVGYGLGSSGAVTAAVYDAICVSKRIGNHDVLRNRLAKMENYFHGKSSGTDPLVSLIDKTVLIQDDQPQIRKKININEHKNFTICLYDSGRSRSSEGLIQSFTKSVEKVQFTRMFLDPMNELVDTASRQLLEKGEGLRETFKKVSRLQLEYMQPMILPSVKSVWEKGLESDRYYMKLCGAGGGGMYLALVPEKHREKVLSDKRIMPL